MLDHVHVNGFGMLGVLGVSLDLFGVLFAVLDAQGWVIIIAAFFLGLQKMYSMRIEAKREADKVLRDEAIASKVAEVATAQAAEARKNAEVAAAQREAAQTVAKKVDQVAQVAKVAAAKVEEVALVAAQSTASQTEAIKSIAEVGVATHTLVNSNMGMQLKISSVALLRVADLTGDSADIEAAGLAERLYSEHQARQAVVDQVKKDGV